MAQFRFALKGEYAKATDDDIGGDQFNVWLDGVKLRPEASQAKVNHSPDGFSWGYPGSRPAQLAQAIMLEVFKDASLAFCATYYHKLKREVIAALPEQFDVTIEGIYHTNGEQGFFKIDKVRHNQPCNHDTCPAQDDKIECDRVSFVTGAEIHFHTPKAGEGGEIA